MIGCNSRPACSSASLLCACRYEHPGSWACFPMRAGRRSWRRTWPAFRWTCGRGGRAVFLPWEIVATVAAAVHGADVQPLAATETPFWRMPGDSTRRDHALAELTIFEGLSDPLVQEVHAWALEHLPPAEPSVLIHGDLLGQNILLAPGQPTGLIDWERAQLGDPAYDLAIVTRGGRQPFKINRGLDRLLEAYAAVAPEVLKEHVHLYELCLLTRWYRESLDPQVRSHPPEETLDRLRRHFRRVTEVRS